MPSTMEQTDYGTVLIRVVSSNQNDNRPSAIVVLCHGLGGKSESFVPFAEHIATQMPHIEFIIPTAPTQRVTKNMGSPMPSWYDVTGNERENETYEGIDQSAAKLTDILRHAHSRTGVPYSRMVMAGFSQGAALSLFTGMQLGGEEDIGNLAGIILFSGYLPCSERLSQDKLSARGISSTPILHLHGDQDTIIPLKAAYESQNKLKGQGVTSYKVKVYKGLMHSISSHEIDDALVFLQTKLPKVPTKSKSPTKRKGAQFIGSKSITIALLALTGVALIAIRFTYGNNVADVHLKKDHSVTLPHAISPEQIRFNKFSIVEPSHLIDPACTATLPFGPAEYLLSGSKYGHGALCMLMNHSTAVSVVAVDDWETRDLDIADLLSAVGGPPSQPSSDESADYWNRLEKVIDVQKLRLKRGKELSRVALPDFPLPYRWVEFTVNQVAEAVHNEYPGLHQSNLIADLMGGTYGQLELDPSIIPQRSRVEFLRGVVMLTELNQWAIGRVGPYNFMSKWHVGRARPEEMVAAIQVGAVSNVPPEIQRKVDGLPTDFTAYVEGSPGHPSWPAMHGAASGLSFWLAVVLDITPQQHCQAKLTDFAVAWGRTVAGVHYEDDNVAGLDMGQEVIAHLIPDHLAKTYGADISKVKAKVDAMRFSWRDFDPKDPCPGIDWKQWACHSKTRRCSFRGPATS